MGSNKTKENRTNDDYIVCRNLRFRNNRLANMIGKTPLLRFECGNCGKNNRCKFSHDEVVSGKTFHKCKKCGIYNRVPINVSYWY